MVALPAAGVAALIEHKRLRPPRHGLAAEDANVARVGRWREAVIRKIDRLTRHAAGAACILLVAIEQ
eukprot:scaffold69693_cov39-Tisochrysis_lutea.AAC.1